MQNFFQKQNTQDDFLTDARVKEYINKYIKELQRHFDMSDKKMRSILYDVYKELKPVNFIISLIKNSFYMLKSKYNDFIARINYRRK